MKVKGVEIGPRPKTAYDLLMKVKEVVLAEPARLDMANWLITDQHVLLARARARGAKPPMCGTVGCIAGWARTIARPTKALANSLQLKYDVGGYIGTGGIAAHLLGGKAEEVAELDNYESGPFASLFFVSQWPADLQDRLQDNQNGTAEYAAVVAERIDRFAAEHKKRLQRTSLTKRLQLKNSK